MLIDFFYALRRGGIPVSLHEHLALLDALQQGLGHWQMDDFYALARAIYVKQEAQLDRFDLLFGEYFGTVSSLAAFLAQELPADWLREQLLQEIDPEELERLGGLDALMERLRELLAEQNEAHFGGNKWIGSGGTSPFGAFGQHPEGIRTGGESRNRSALKVWEQRAFRNYDDRVELNTRNIKLILKRLRNWTREGLPTELDLDETIRRTSANAGVLDLALQPTRANRVKVLLLMDVGGSMDDHIELCEQLFSAARWEFKHLEFYYFHNCVYESVWRDNRRRYHEKIPTLELLRRYNSDYKLIFVGDAAMSPYEIFYRGGSVEHYNDESGIAWLGRLRDHFPNMAWINPMPDYEWDFFESVNAIRAYTRNRMFPMTVTGLTQAMRCLRNPKRTYDNKIWGDAEKDD